MAQKFTSSIYLSKLPEKAVVLTDSGIAFQCIGTPSGVKYWAEPGEEALWDSYELSRQYPEGLTLIHKPEHNG